jgi:hypothetical protein
MAGTSWLGRITGSWRAWAIALIAAGCESSGVEQPPAVPTTPPPPSAVSAAVCKRNLHASVVALDQAMMINRLGTARPGGMIYALERDVVSDDGSADLKAGHVRLRAGKRPRPMVLRMNVGDCVEIDFKNLLNPTTIDPNQPQTREASIHVTGLSPVKSITDDGNYVGQNPSGMVAPGKSTTYHLHAGAEGSFLLYSTSASFNGFGNMQMSMGLFGAVNVEPENAEYYRSQVTADDLKLARKCDGGRCEVDGYPIVDYDARYPAGAGAGDPRACGPVLKMLDVVRRAEVRDGRRVCVPVSDRLEIQHTDLTAIITGPKAGRFPEGQAGFPKNPALPDRRQPFREVTIHYHESQDVIQAFKDFYAVPDDPNQLPLSYTLQTGQDGFAINYGVAGIGAEILANRIGTGASAGCVDCKYEEFFLSSWALGDPAMMVDVPANNPATPQELEACQGDPKRCPSVPAPSKKRATKAYFPDDPSNVYHSYLGDHVTFRILHAGASVHHVHHHHAHQWLRSPMSDDSHYLDSQAIGPGASFSLDLAYAGSGNRNLTPGDSIFHCHFYPHFAGGMWALFRVHDVFEAGTELDKDQRPAPNARALPDAEIAAGTPIPAVVPLPTKAMAPLPTPVRIKDGQVEVLGKGNPGFPFFVPGAPGHRAPHPPLDFAVDPKTGEKFDGGLPRHLVTGGNVSNEKHTPYDFSKDLDRIDAVELDEKGTPVERAAMAAHSTREHHTYLPDGSKGVFLTNGLPGKPGAPFADPAVDDQGKPVCPKDDKSCKLVYKGANIQVDTVFNKAGWHFPQQRMITLWEDVKPTLDSKRPPEPFFFRANSGQVVEYWHANLVPAYYELDDFQVRTPTDILGQHIHLVKFDVLASDGAANGFNYEDGTFSPDEVRDRIAAINKAGGLAQPGSGAKKKLTAKAIPDLGKGPGNKWVGAQATVQRWYADPLLDNTGKDRTITTVFTHDHFGPSTHQQVGLYGALVIEPANSSWTLADGTAMGTRADGGPTSYAARVLTKPEADSYREFLLAWQDLQLVYNPSSKSKIDPYSPTSSTYLGWADPNNVINPPTANSSSQCPTGYSAPCPQPQVISDFAAGMLSLNYRTEPVPLRVNKPKSPAKLSPADEAAATDLSQSFRSIPRLDPAFNQQPRGGAPINPDCKAGQGCFRYPVEPIAAGMGPTDPYTPLLGAYENDKVQIRVVAGGHTSMHDFGVHGIRWLYEPHDADSGYRATQFTVISEHFEMGFTVPPATTDASRPFADYLYTPGSSFEGLVNGLWGILRAHDGSRGKVKGIEPLPNNPRGSAPPGAVPKIPAGLSTRCGEGAPCLREIHVAAISAQRALGGPLVYNDRGITKEIGGTFYPSTPITDPDAILYVRVEDLDPATGKLKAGVPVEPLVLRAAAGDWIKVTLENRLSPKDHVFSAQQSAARPTVPWSSPYAGVNVTPSTSVGLHAQLVSYDVTKGDGADVGMNPVQTVPVFSGGTWEDHLKKGDFPRREYTWYAGIVTPGPDGAPKATPAELGAINLIPSDPLLHGYHGLVGALVVEPLGATWVEDTDQRASATVFTKEGGVFRDFTVVAQDDIGVKLEGLDLYNDGQIPISAFNYRTEPMLYRFGSLVGDSIENNGTKVHIDWSKLTPDMLQAIGNYQWTAIDTHLAVANHLTGGDPETPIFRAPAGMPVRFRLVYPTGTGDNQQTWEVTGHSWQEEPYRKGSTEIGFNPKSNWTGTTTGYGPTSHFDIAVPSAGGPFQVSGDYLYRSWMADQFQLGLWGILRVAPAAAPGAGFPDTVSVDKVARTSQGFKLEGAVTVDPKTRGRAKGLKVAFGQGGGEAAVDAEGRWSFEGQGTIPEIVTVTSPNGGVAVVKSEPPKPKPSTGGPAHRRRIKRTKLKK